MSTVIDRMTINWQGEHEVNEALRFRKQVGSRNINKTLKALIREWMKAKEHTHGVEAFTRKP